MSDRVCPRCKYVGNPRLCGCMSELRAALEASDLVRARLLFAEIVGVGRAMEDARRADLEARARG